MWLETPPGVYRGATLVHLVLVMRPEELSLVVNGRVMAKTREMAEVQNGKAFLEIGARKFGVLDELVVYHESLRLNEIQHHCETLGIQVQTFPEFLSGAAAQIEKRTMLLDDRTVVEAWKFLSWVSLIPIIAWVGAKGMLIAHRKFR
jgi:hypothetical protein